MEFTKVILKKRYGVGKTERRNGMKIQRNRILGAP